VFSSPGSAAVSGGIMPITGGGSEGYEEPPGASGAAALVVTDPAKGVGTAGGELEGTSVARRRASKDSKSARTVAYAGVG
jgi:hypothetical protein